VVYTKIEVAEMLKVSSQTIDKEIKRGKLTRIKIGARVLIMEDDLKIYLENSKRIRGDEVKKYEEESK